MKKTNLRDMEFYSTVNKLQHLDKACDNIKSQCIKVSGYNLFRKEGMHKRRYYGYVTIAFLLETFLHISL